MSVLLVSCAPERVCHQSFSPPLSVTQQPHYIVKRDDSLWKIAKEYGVNIESIMKANNISSASDLKVGQDLKIPTYFKSNARLSFIWPLKGQIVNRFGEKVGNIVNKGINIKNKSSGSVLAAEEGKAIYVDHIKGWGKTVIIKHSENFYTVYANLYEILTKENNSVKKGEVIGKLSAAGSYDNDILHFEIRKGYSAGNPLEYFKGG
ncbi:MAG: peptidoglycan DD-metalloendopeptidase family protein [Candidatus Omnitrophota bacterium]|nr:peptidoglycan DD-metalloendopeptidase family protein [Candidatus Omnitrophota bacterium]